MVDPMAIPTSILDEATFFFLAGTSVSVSAVDEADDTRLLPEGGSELVAAEDARFLGDESELVDSSESSCKRYHGSFINCILGTSWF